MAPKIKTYKREQLVSALADLRNGLSYRVVSQKHNIPRSTLFNKLTGKYDMDKDKPGPVAALTAREERHLVDYLKGMSAIGHGLNRIQLKEEVKRLLDGGRDAHKRFKNNNLPSTGWVIKFLRRHKAEITSRTPQHLSIQRAFVTENNLRTWFSDFKSFLMEEHGIIAEEFLSEANANRIFNSDESGFPLADRSKPIKEEDILVAVLLTETFNNNFQPLIKNDPLVLMPLANTPLLDYSLDWLQRCEVNETIVYCCAQPYADRVRDHCKQWTIRHGNFMNIIVVSSENCTSLGDAMRDLYSKSFLKKDFILLTGDVVGNLDLRSLIEKHKVTRKKNPSAIMSCIYLQNQEKKRQLDECRVINLIVNTKNSKIIVHNRPGNSLKLALHIQDALQVGLKFNVLSRFEDPNIAICSELIPSLFSDNFDYDSRDSLVQGIIEQEELLGYSIHAQIINEGYASRISSFRAYQEVSEAVIRRLNFPSVPERSLSSYRIRYLFQPFSGSYWDTSAKFNKKSIDNNVVIDAGTDIDTRAKINNSVIGKHCIIKENVSIKDSFILSNVFISQGCILESCFVGNNVKLLPGVNLEPGVVVGHNVILGPNLKVDRSSRLMSQPPLDLFTGKPQIKKLDLKVCGPEGNAFLYEKEDMEEDVSQTVPWGSIISEICEDKSYNGNDFTSDDEDGDSDNNQPEEEAYMSDSEKAEQEFIKEVNDSLLNGLREESDYNNVILEINSSRHAYNVSMNDVLKAVTKGLLHVGEDLVGEKLSGEQLWDAVEKSLRFYADMLRNYVKKTKDQLNVLKAIEERVNEDRRLLSIIQKLLYELNQELEIIDDEVICFWYGEKGSTAVFPAISKIIAKMVAWLEENDDSDDD